MRTTWLKYIGLNIIASWKCHYREAKILICQHLKVYRQYSLDFISYSNQYKSFLIAVLKIYIKKNSFSLFNYSIVIKEKNSLFLFRKLIGLLGLFFCCFHFASFFFICIQFPIFLLSSSKNLRV